MHFILEMYDLCLTHELRFFTTLMLGIKLIEISMHINSIILDRISYTKVIFQRECEFHLLKSIFNSNPTTIPLALISEKYNAIFKNIVFRRG